LRLSDGRSPFSLRRAGKFPFTHPFDPLRAPRAGLERIRKVLCFSYNLVAAELHDAHGVRRPSVIRRNIFGDPKITATNDSPLSWEPMANDGG